MTIFNKMFRKQQQKPTPLASESPGKLMILGILIASSEIFGDDARNYRKRKGQTFELIILSTLLILRRFRDLIPEYYNEFEDDLFAQIYFFARHEQIIQMLPDEFSDFINSRLALYDDEFTLDEEGDVKLPARTTYNLFERPLLKNSDMCEDIFKVMELQIKFHSYYKLLLMKFEYMISVKYVGR